MHRLLSRKSLMPHCMWKKNVCSQLVFFFWIRNGSMHEYFKQNGRTKCLRCADCAGLQTNCYLKIRIYRWHTAYPTVKLQCYQLSIYRHVERSIRVNRELYSRPSSFCNQNVWVGLKNKIRLKKIRGVVLSSSRNYTVIMSEYLFKRRSYGLWSIFFISLFLVGAIFSLFLFDIIMTKMITRVSISAWELMRKLSAFQMKFKYRNLNGIALPFNHHADNESTIHIQRKTRLYKSVLSADLYRIHIWYT